MDTKRTQNHFFNAIQNNRYYLSTIMYYRLYYILFYIIIFIMIYVELRKPRQMPNTLVLKFCQYQYFFHLFHNSNILSFFIYCYAHKLLQENPYIHWNFVDKRVYYNWLTLLWYKTRSYCYLTYSNNNHVIALGQNTLTDFSPAIKRIFKYCSCIILFSRLYYLCL